MKKLFTFVLCMCLLISCIPNVRAVSEPLAEAEPDAEAYRTEEVLELRTENSETYKMSDGTYQCEVYAENKYYLDEKGEYCLIDNTIIPQEHSSGTTTYQYANAASDAKVYFSDEIPSVLLSCKGHQLAFRMENSEISQVKVGARCNSYDFPEIELQAENCLTYYDAAQSTDLVYSVFTGGVKEYLMLKDPEAPSEFRFSYDTTDYTIEANEFGTLSVYDEAGNLVFEFGSLYAIDSAGKGTEAVFYDILETKDNVTSIGIRIDEDYLNDPNRVYPILVDPSATMSDTVSGYSSTFDACVCSLYPNTNYGSNSFLRTGKDPDYGVRRTYIEFAIPSNLAGKTVSSATIRFYWAGGSSSSIKLYSILNSWRSANVTWNTQPTCGTSVQATLGGTSGSWYSASITSLVQTWLDNDNNNHGVKLQDTTESDANHWTTFNSSESSSEYKPSLTINYLADSGNYTISYYGNGNTGGSVPASQSAVNGRSVTLRTNSGNLTKSGYSFYGWSTSAYVRGTTYLPGQTITMPSGHLTLYAKWVKTYYMYVYYTPNMGTYKNNRISNALESTKDKYLEYGIQIVVLNSSASSLLNYRTTSTTCAVAGNLGGGCEGTCGSDTLCSTKHHRNSGYYNTQLSATIRVLRIVNWDLCNYEMSKSEHVESAGFRKNGTLDMVCNVNYNALEQVIIHELGHTFGLADGYNNENPYCQPGCYMNVPGSMDGTFCPSCTTQLLYY